ncbi:hypothetical protein L3073_12075 [Ancylomarina sp. DW003]|nr:hypothetical protein [Ancylomarina sp. DW003]MDE5422945.1 hypothetical protein [Ancylomarina sp. DW003]
MKHQIRILITTLLLSICSIAFAQVKWIKTKSEKSKVSFELPETPYLRNQELNGINSEVFAYRDVAHIYGVVASDFSTLKVDFRHNDPSEYYTQMKEGSLLSSDAILTSEQSVTYKRMIGKEISYTMMVGKHEYTYFKRFFFRNQFIYQFTIGGPTRMKQVLYDKKAIFFDSIQFE